MRFVNVLVAFCRKHDSKLQSSFSGPHRCFDEDAVEMLRSAGMREEHVGVLNSDEDLERRSDGLDGKRWKEIEWGRLHVAPRGGGH